MQENKVSWTALLTAYARAYHATHDDPKIFDDTLADPFLTEQERASFGAGLAKSLEFIDPERAAACADSAAALAWYMRLQGGPVTLSRSRYTEDHLLLTIAHGVRQYILLGAGMDTFAFRRRELLGQLAVFEVDELATQAFKRQRLAELGWALPPQLHFVPIDFATESLADALRRSPYDPRALSFFSWLGVTYYLSREVVLETLRRLAEVAAPGSLILFDYLEAEAFVPGRAARRMERMQELVRRIGEPLQAGFEPDQLAADLAAVGWRLQDNLSPAQIEDRYFRGRVDGYHAYEHFHFAQAVVQQAG